jgi:hypothetical protein
MSYEIPGFTRSYEPAADLSGQQLRFVKLNGALIDVIAAATDPGIGVLQNKPVPASTVGSIPGGGLTITSNVQTSGTVMVSGVSRVYASVAFAAGVPVYLDTDGRVTNVAAANKAVGVAETASAGAGSIVAVLLKPLGAL